jgi:hypothetical protein
MNLASGPRDPRSAVDVELMQEEMSCNRSGDYVLPDPQVTASPDSQSQRSLKRKAGSSRASGTNGRKYYRILLVSIASSDSD